MHGVVAAGAIAPPELRARGVERIPLLRVGGETVLARVCRCLLTGGGCEHVHVLAPPEVELPDDPAVSRAPYTGGIVDDVLSCVSQLTSGEAVLVASGDMPLLTPEAVAALCEYAAGSGAVCVYPLGEREAVEARFPGTKRTYRRVGGKDYTGGNVFWLSRDWFLERGPLFRELFARRKDPIGLARLFGLWFTLRVLFGWVTLEYIERYLSRLLRGQIRAAVLPFPELAVDLDKNADLDTFVPYLDAF